MYKWFVKYGDLTLAEYSNFQDLVDGQWYNYAPFGITIKVLIDNPETGSGKEFKWVYTEPGNKEEDFKTEDDVNQVRYLFVVTEKEDRELPIKELQRLAINGLLLRITNHKSDMTDDIFKDVIDLRHSAIRYIKGWGSDDNIVKIIKSGFIYTGLPFNVERRIRVVDGDSLL